MARLYSPNEDHNQKGIGVEFYYGAGVSTVASVIANLQAKGYTVDATANALSIFDKLPKSELVTVAQAFGLTTTDKTKQTLVSDIEKYINLLAIPVVGTVASSGLTNLVLTLNEALYDGSNAVANNADIKAKFTASTGLTITSAVYTTTDKKITFVLEGAATGAILTYTESTLKDGAGGILANLAFVAGAAVWAAADITTLGVYEQLTTEKIVLIAATMGITTEGQTKRQLITAIEAFINAGILPVVTDVASSGLTNLVLTLSEALYDGEAAVANNADIKAKFTPTGCTITSAVYTTADKKITFIIGGDGTEGDTITYTGNTLKDSAGGILDQLSYTAGAAAWAVTP